MAQTRRIMISLPNTLLQEVDGIVRQERINRSYFIREELQEGYLAMSQINLLLANEAVQAENEAVKTIESMVGGA